jgi:hypothetical protein
MERVLATTDEEVYATLVVTVVVVVVVVVVIVVVVVGVAGRLLIWFAGDSDGVRTSS